MAKEQNRIDKIYVLLFILAQLVLFPLIQLSEGDMSDQASYLSIILVVVFAVFVFKCERAEHFVQLGLVLTLVADYFLVLCYDAEIKGVVTFITVQLAYCLYLVYEEKRRAVRRINIGTRIVLSVILVAVTFAVLGEDTDALSLVSVIYYANLLTNIVFSFLLGRRARIFAIGLTLFALCDLCIGLETLTSVYFDSDIFAFLYSDTLNLPWVFYQPSQVLIALSLLHGKNKI